MKVSVIQPRYSMNGDDLDACFSALLSLLDECDESLDLIVLPEYSDVPADVKGEAGFADAVAKNNELLLKKASETARRCHALLFVNAAYKTEDGLRNTTHAFDRKGRPVGRYFKAHPAPSEVRGDEEGGHGLDTAYSYEPRAPYVLELEGLRFCFLTCYDFYFYEGFARIALERPDIIIGASLQRTDSHEALSIIHRFLCYQTNAYLVRASVSLGEDSTRSGCSTVVAPSGEVLLDMKSRCGIGIAEIDPAVKFTKPAGHGGATKPHFEYIEEGRRPWLYRNAGPGIVRFEDITPYPRLCAHRGLHRIAPENSLPAYGAAVALGATEIEVDVWASADGVLVSCHDATLERVSDGEGKIYEKTYAELSALDFGVRYDERYRGLRIPTFEDILKKFGGRCIMNIHVKLWEVDIGRPMIKEIVDMIRKYDCQKHVYLMVVNDDIHRAVKEYAPDIPTCVGWDGNREPLSMVERAIALGAEKVQLYKPYFNEETVRLAHEHGILCNVFWSNDVKEAEEYLRMGIDTILTDDYLALSNALTPLLEKMKGNRYELHEN